MFTRSTLKNQVRTIERNFLFSLGLAAGIAAWCASTARAQVVTLVNQNSVAQVNVGTQQGMFNWTVDGQQQLFQQWFWYRVGAAGPEQSINAISAPSFSMPTPSMLSTTYTAPGFNITVLYTLNGAPPGSGSADLGESITINNTSGAPLDFHFFQYSDFDLSSSTGPQTSTLLKNNNPLSPNFNKFVEADQVNGLVSVSETVVTPGADHGEAGLYPSTINRLNDPNPTTLNDVMTSAAGDATWALEWDSLMAASGLGSTLQISKDKHLAILAIPEPSSLALASIGVGLLGCTLRRRNSAK